MGSTTPLLSNAASGRVARLAPLACLALMLPAAAHAQETSAPTYVPTAPMPFDPIARDYVDVGLHGGPCLRGSSLDGRYAELGYALGATIDIGRPPFWGGLYSDICEVDGKSGVVDPLTHLQPSVQLISAGWRGKAAIRLLQRIFLMPALGAGFGVVDYSAGPCRRYVSNDCHNLRHMGLGIQASVAFIYCPSPGRHPRRDFSDGGDD